MNQLLNLNVSPYRDDQCRGPEPGGTRIPDAESSGLSSNPLRHHAGVLAQGPNEETDLRNPTMAA